MKTRDKIVHAAIELFNADGERNVTTNHIASHIGISPGNLYYHFRNKQEIVREIFALYSQELIERFTPIQGQQKSLLLFKHYLDSIFTLMWKYRFFYANLPEILQRDPELHREYIDVQERLQGNLINILRVFVELDLLNVAEEDLTPLVTTLHMIAASWLSYQSAMSSTSKITEEVLFKGMLQIINVVKPLSSSSGLEQLNLLEDGIKMLEYSSEES